MSAFLKQSREQNVAQAEALSHIEDRLRWLSCWTIHHANHIRESRDGLKVGGHQASCSSMITLMTALYFDVLTPIDRVAVKPHASPVLHGVNYLLGHQSLEQLKSFRAFGGAQSYPSRTKDKIRVDFSTGSVGLGVAVTAFASLVQDYLIDHGLRDSADRGRMIALLGDAELDEGNIYEALIESYKHDIRNTWWIVDYNRQSLDAVASDRMYSRFADFFSTAGWEVVVLKYGKKQLAAFEKPGGQHLKEWIDACRNQLYSALTYRGGAAWRGQILSDIGSKSGIETLLDDYSDDTLEELMTELGGHCLETVLEAFHDVDDDRPRLFIAYTVKGHGLPLQGHKDNHAGLMTPSQIVALRSRMSVREGEEWEPLAGLSVEDRQRVQAVIEGSSLFGSAGAKEELLIESIAVPNVLPLVTDAKISTQMAFGKILNDLARADDDLARRLVTTSPDVTVSTNLGGFVNQRGRYERSTQGDTFKESKIPSTQKWAAGKSGQHIELGIAENNLFLLLAALGLSNDLFGKRLLPIGTVYDPFIARGLDALNYACYQDARFMLVATPSGLSLGPEGGAHQSIGSPLIGMSQPGLTYFEPAFVDELSLIMRWAFEFMQEPEGEAVYLRLSTRALDQIERPNDTWRTGALKGAYWLKEPSPGTEIAIVYCGALAPEALAAHEAIREDIPGAGLLAVTSPDLLHRDFMAASRDPWAGGGRRMSYVEELFSGLKPTAGLVTLVDGAPQTLSWLGSVGAYRVSPLGVEIFGQVGDLPDLYQNYRLDVDAILDSIANLVM